MYDRLASSILSRIKDTSTVSIWSSFSNSFWIRINLTDSAFAFFCLKIKLTDMTFWLHYSQHIYVSTWIRKIYYWHTCIVKMLFLTSPVHERCMNKSFELKQNNDTFPRLPMPRFPASFCSTLQFAFVARETYRDWPSQSWKRIYHCSILKDDTYCIEVNKVKAFGILNCNNNWLQNFLIINNCVLAFLCRAVRVWLDWVITNWSLGCLCICNLSSSSARTFSLRLISCTCLFVSGKSLIGVIVFLRQSTFFRERTRL